MAWKENFAKNKFIDQSLLNPNKSNDKKYGLNRYIVYSHTKSWQFFKKLRKEIGAKVFDSTVIKYINLPFTMQTYEYFVSLFPQKYKFLIRKIEKDFEV